MHKEIEKTLDDLSKYIKIGQEHVMICEALRKIAFILSSQIGQKEDCNYCQQFRKSGIFEVCKHSGGNWNLKITTMWPDYPILVKHCPCCGKELS